MMNKKTFLYLKLLPPSSKNRKKRFSVELTIAGLYALSTAMQGIKFDDVDFKDFEKALKRLEKGGK